MPVYVIWGEKDGLIPISTGFGIVRRSNVPADHWIVIPDCGHIANREKPEEFESILLRILK
jgi:pimeloyl-ACP methyl ester carboxylesterase